MINEDNKKDYIKVNNIVINMNIKICILNNLGFYYF